MFSVVAIHTEDGMCHPTMLELAVRIIRYISASIEAKRQRPQQKASTFG